MTIANLFTSSLLTVGRTVDEAAILYSMLENACHSQLMAEAAAANGLPKKIINDEAARFTAQAAQNPVRIHASPRQVTRSMLTIHSTISTLNSSLNLS